MLAAVFALIAMGLSHGAMLSGPSLQGPFAPACGADRCDVGGTLQTLTREGRDDGAHSLRQNVNAFYGDEIPSMEGRTEFSPRDRFFVDCWPPISAAKILASQRFSPGEGACASLVTLLCDGVELEGYSFHLVKLAGAAPRYRIYTAAHVVNAHNKKLPSGASSGLYDYRRCSVRFANGGVSLAGVSISQANFRTPEVRSLVASRQITSFSAVDFMRANDIAWFDVDPGDKADLVDKVSLPIYRGNLAALPKDTRICSAGFFGGTLEAVYRCMRGAGAAAGAAGTIDTRVATVAGMSGGPLLANVDGKNYALGVIASEWTPPAGFRERMDSFAGTRSLVYEFAPGRENSAVRY